MKKFWGVKRVVAAFLAAVMVVTGVVSGDMTVHAAEKEVTLTLHGNAEGARFYKDRGGKDTTKIKIPYGTTLFYGEDTDLAPFEYTPKGKVLLGWSTSTNKSDLLASEEYRIYKDTDLYAIWTTAKVFTFDANGGKFSDGKKKRKVEVHKGSIVDIDTLNEDSPKYSNKKFIGWSNDKNAKYAEDDREIYVKKNRTFYAVYVKTPVKVTYDSGKGYFTSDYSGKKSRKKTINTEKGAHPDTPSVIAPDKYEFIGWSTEKNGKPISIYDYFVTKDITFYAVYTKKVKITFNMNGGIYYSDKKLEREYYTGQCVLTDHFDLDSRNIYDPNGKKVFVGWSKKKNGKAIDLSKEFVKKKKTYYAVWEDGYQVTLKAGDHGKVKAYKGYTSTDKKEARLAVKKGEREELKWYEVNVTEDKGYEFKGWSTTRNAADIIDTYNFRPDGDVTLTAVWDAPAEEKTVTDNDCYIITWDANGGVFNYGIKRLKANVVKGEEASVPSPGDGWVTHKEHKVLLGWGKTKTGDIINQYQYIPTGNETLYAIWADTYRIKIDMNGGKCYGTSRYLYGYVQKGHTLLDISDILGYVHPGKNGVTLAGFSLKKNGKVIKNISDYKPTKNQTIYAIWKKGKSIVATLKNDGKGMAQDGYFYTGKQIKPEVDVTDENGKKLKKNKDYTISYRNNTEVGTAYVIVKGKGKYMGEKRLDFDITYDYDCMKTITAESTAEKTINVSWDAVKGADGYEITCKDSAGNVKTTEVEKGTTNYTMENLTSNETYRISVSAYWNNSNPYKADPLWEKVDGNKMYSYKSVEKTVKVK
ncbi:MAG: fibronectin type III domain-containing protein [Lachnospiraceae bacterium]|nr:fibronectin type III domain-containing protein [Lachnospiraceae bacterium]